MMLLHLVPQEQTYPIEITPTRHVKRDSDVVVSFKFSDGTIAAIAFSSKGHTFEGVREKFHAHKGDCLITMEDFQTMVVEVVEKIIVI